jgi:hypothetical protein
VHRYCYLVCVQMLDSLALTVTLHRQVPALMWSLVLFVNLVIHRNTCFLFFPQERSVQLPGLETQV